MVLAVIVGPFTWLYTYKQDGAKFWGCLAIVVVGAVLNIVTLGLWAALTWWLGYALWIGAIVDTLRKSGDWYRDY